MTRVASSRLIGRQAELADLEAALGEAADGRPSLAFVAGDSGVGKTRLLAELTARARDGGALVLSGDCVDFGDEGELPYLPLVAALRPLARDADPALTDAVAALLPGAPGPGADGQAQLFEGLLELLDTLGRERPVLLVIEDLHWADRSTRAALAFLARGLTEERVLVVSSYRSDELLRSHPLRPLLVELELHPRARRVVLAPLTREELAEQLTDILDAPPDAELLDRLWTRAAGNPLFGEELLAAGLDGRGAAPDTLRDVLMLRVERLSDPARELLGLVAVGQRLDDRLLEETAGLEPRALREALREAIDGHILAVQDDGLYRFRHALLREVVEADLLPGERAELHLALARALEQRLEDDAQATGAVAHHYAAADEQPAALAAAVRAAAAAERVHGYAEAAALLDRALALWDRVPDAEARAGADRVTVLVRAADAASALGDPGRQLGLLETALVELGPDPDRSRAARILEATGGAQRHLNRAAASAATLERALTLADEPGDRASVLAGLGRAYMILNRYADASRVAREALDAAVAAGLPLVEGRARNTLGDSLAMSGDVEAGAAELRAAIAIAREHDDLGDLSVAYLNYSNMLHVLGRSQEALAVAAEGRDAVGGRRPISMLWFDLNIAEFAFDSGDWPLAEATLPSAEPWTGAQSRFGIGLRRAAMALGKGDDAAAAALLDELAPMAEESSEPQALAPFAVLVAERHRRAGETGAARAAIDRWLARIDDSSDDAMRAAAVAAMGIAVEADAAELARDLGDAAPSGRVDALLARVAAAATDTRPVERAALEGARADAARAAGAPDAAAYARAAEAWEQAGRPEPAGRMRWREAEIHAAAEDREAATEAAGAAHAIATRVGADWLRQQVERLAGRARLTLATAAPAPAEPPEAAAFGLTARERQVLELLAEGATNREIGATLYMAEKTASVHVSRILTKLNARSRTEAASIAHRHGLTD